MDLSSIDPELDRLVNGPKRKRVSYPDQEQEQGIVGNLRDNSLTMLGAIGNTLDLPGSMVRDVVAWKNPFDQILSPFSDKNRTTGRDLARKWGIAKKRDTYGNFWGGLGIEAALDPLTYATLGGSALSKAGIAAKNAGLMDDLARVSARKLGKPIGMVGPREGRIATTLADFVAEGGDVGARAQKAINAGANADEALGGVMGIGLPFADPMKVFGNGARGQSIARGMDTGARLLRFAKIPGTEIKPVNAFLNLFDAPAKGMDTPIGQAIARENFRKQQKAEFMPRLETARWATEMENAGLTDQASMDKLRGYIELSHDPFSKFQRKDVGDTIANIGDQIRAQVDSAVQQQKAVGIRASELTDQYVDFLSRQMTQSNSFKPKTGDLALNATTQASKKRNDFLRNVPGGTERLKNELFMDPELNRLVDEGKTRKQIAQYIKKKHGDWFNDSDYMVYRPNDPKANIDGYVPGKGRVQKTATWFSKLSKELRDTGVFGNTPLADHEGYMLSKARGEVNARSLAQALAQPGVIQGESLAGNAAADGSKTISDIMKSAGLSMETFNKEGDRVGGFMDILLSEAHKLGTELKDSYGNKLDFKDITAKDLNRMRVSKDIASDVTNIMKAISGPQEVSKLIQVTDSIVNAFKAHVTGPWPNFQVRNLMSGMAHNFMFGMWDSQSTKDAAKMIQGGVIKDASKNPFVIAEWERRQKLNPPPGGPSQPPGNTTPGGGPAGNQGLGGGSGFVDPGPFGKPSPPRPPKQKTPPTPIDTPPSGVKPVDTNPKRGLEWDILTFSKQSFYHAKFNDKISKLVNDKLLTKMDADLLRLAFFDASEDGMAILTRPAYGIMAPADREHARGLFSYAGKTPLSVELNPSLSKSSPDDVRSSFNTFIHELMHAAEHHIKTSADPRMKELSAEIDAFFKGRPDEIALKQKNFWTDVYDEFGAKYYGRTDGQLTESFAQMNADYISMRMPKSKIAQIVQTMKHWIVGFLQRIRLARKLPSEYNKRLYNIIEEVIYGNAPGGKKARRVKGSAFDPDVPPGAPVTKVYDEASGSGPKLTDEEATRILGEMASASGLVGKFEGLGGNVVGAAPGPSTSGNIQDILSGIMRPGVKSLDWKRVGRKYIGREPGTSIKPKDWFATRGVGGATESKYGPAAGGEEIGHSVESLIRLSGWFNQMRKGVDPLESAKRVGDAQVLYGNKNYTNFETQWMTRMMPFYKFSRKMIPQIVQDLAQRPGGRYGQMIRMMRASQDQGELAPDYVRDSLSIPFANNPVLEAVMGKAPEGTDRYITGFGLPHEDLLSFSPTARGSMLELLSRTNPLIKAPLEFATGETFFQRGPEGGRELSKLDPTVGRLISNLGRMTGLRESTDPVRLPQVVEQAITNSPLTKAVTTARMLTDERKQSNYGILPFKVPGVPALSNVLTGVRVNDVSPQAKQAMVDELLQNQMKERGASEFSRTRFSKKDLEKMDPVDRQIAEQLNSYANLLAKRTKERVKQKEKEKAGEKK